MTGNRKKLGVDQLVRGRFQPREFFDEAALEELADTIARDGMVQPIVVRPVSSGKYEILAGERRWRAAQLACVHEVAVIIRDDVTDEQALRISLTENIQRENLTPIEEARAYARLRDEFGMRQENIAEAVGKNRAHIAHMLRLLSLPLEIQDYLQRSELDIGHGKSLLGAPEDTRVLLAREAAKKRLSVRQLEERVDQWARRDKVRSATPVNHDPDLQRLNTTLTEHLGLVCEVEQPKGKKKVVLRMRFSSLENLNGALEHFGPSIGGTLEIHAKQDGTGVATAVFSSLDAFQQTMEKAGVLLD